MAWWPLGRNRQKPTTGVRPAVPPLIRSVELDGAWRDLPALQRTVADPLQPVAINDDFRNSLTSYADPSFVAPLAHQVEPETGGLVDGLVSPGTPYAHPSGPELAVPHRVDPPASSRPLSSTNSRHVGAPPVQRSAPSLSASHLPTAALELPGMRLPRPKSEPAWPEESSVTEVASPPRTSVPDRAPVRENPAVDHGADSAAAATANRELPVVSRSADRSADARQPSMKSDSTDVRPTLGSSSVPSSRELPVVSRSPEPTSGREVWADIKDTPISNDHLVNGDDHVSSTSDHGVQNDDHSLQSLLPPTSAPVQNVATEEQEPGGRGRELPVVTQSQPAKIADSSLPVVLRRTDAPNDPAVQGKQLEKEAPSGAPTLGAEELGLSPRAERAQLTLQRTPMTDRVSAPDEPAVQRVEYVTQQVAPTHRSGATPHASFSAPPAAPTSAPATSAAAAVPLPSLQRLPSHDDKQMSKSLSRHPLAVRRWETQVLERPNEAQMQLVSPVQRMASFEHSASVPAAPPSEQDWHSEAYVESETPAEGNTSEELAVAPTFAVAPTVAELQRPAVWGFPTGPAVVPEPWTPEPPNTVAQAPALGPGAVKGSGSLSTVSRLAADAPIHSTPRHPASTPTLVVGQPILQPRADTASSESRQSGAMSFASMFGAEATAETGSPAADGFTSVQLQTADDSTPPASEPTENSSTPPIATAAPPAVPGGKPADLDELARRLYEPIIARLRAELWLDRERAGVMSNG